MSSAPDGAITVDESTIGTVDKDTYRQFYDQISQGLATTGLGKLSSFLNFGYVSVDDQDEARGELPRRAFNTHSVRLAFELIADTELTGRSVLDVGCGRGGVAALLATEFGAEVLGVDLSPEAIAFCAETHKHPSVRFEVGDAENLPVGAASHDVVTNIESSHTYPDLLAFLSEVRRVLKPGGVFLHTDVLPAQRWPDVREALRENGFEVLDERDITANVLAARDKFGSGRIEVLGEQSALMENFLAVPGSAMYEQMTMGSLQYRIMRSRLGGHR
ncbi:class I SAM-dependent methyltransferase [Nocardia sp. NPDC050793]|uniref:class I SAM-dependent methyltransferase n=1 Tax=Nocardia sp. NPDC050793 TaxID=3155159 RepID=UPI0033E4B81C